MIPKYAATQRGWFAARIATRASRGTRVESQLATLSDMRVSSAKVTRSTVSLPLNLKRNVVGKLPGRFLEPLIEGGHVRRKYYRKSRGMGWSLDQPQLRKAFSALPNEKYAYFVIWQIDGFLAGSGIRSKEGQNALAANLLAPSQNFVEAQRRGSVKAVDPNGICGEHNESLAPPLRMRYPCNGCAEPVDG